MEHINIKWQEGVVEDGMPNGAQPEQVIGVLIARLQELQKGLPCRETALALTKLEESRFWLWERRRLRQEQNVEATYTPHRSANR